MIMHSVGTNNVTSNSRLINLKYSAVILKIVFKKISQYKHLSRFDSILEYIILRGCRQVLIGIILILKNYSKYHIIQPTLRHHVIIIVFVLFNVNWAYFTDNNGLICSAIIIYTYNIIILSTIIYLYW